MSLEVSVISSRSITEDFASWAKAATMIGEVEVLNVADMAAKLVALRNAQAVTAESALIGRLNLMDHSTTSEDDEDEIEGVRCGSDTITTQNLANFETSLRKVHYCMSARGFVHLWHCQIGKNETLIKELARIFGVDVYAGTGNQNAILGFNWGEDVVCSPGGVVKRNVPRPKKID
jgi:hypothetical protein